MSRMGIRMPFFRRRSFYVEIRIHGVAIVRLKALACVFAAKPSGLRGDNKCILFCFSIVAQRPRVSPPSRLGAADGLWVPLAHGLMRTPCDEHKRHWYCVMDFATHTSGSGMAECRAPEDERRQKMFRERNNHNGAKQPGSKHLSNSKDHHKRRRA